MAALGVSLAASWVATLALGRAGLVAPHWFYLPVLLAAYQFGWRAAAVTAAAAMILAGTLMPLDVARHIPQTTGDRVGRGVFILLIGRTMAWFFLASCAMSATQIGPSCLIANRLRAASATRPRMTA